MYGIKTMGESQIVGFERTIHGRKTCMASRLRVSLKLSGLREPYTGGKHVWHQDYG